MYALREKYVTFFWEKYKLSMPHQQEKQTKKKMEMDDIRSRKYFHENGEFENYEAN
jgi:hypothetical protein